MNADFMEKIVKLRQFFGRPMPVLSGYRCPEYDAKVGSSTEPGNGPHTMGRAVDVHVAGKEADMFLTQVFKCGLFTGKGIQQRQRTPFDGRYVHLDDLGENEFSLHPRPSVWSY